VPEWGCLLIYTPFHPKVNYLDARSWLIFDLCDGRTYDELVAEFSEAVPSGTTPEQTRGAVDKGLDALVRNDIVTRTSAIDRIPPKASVG
jgi:hypothetical protein